MNIRVEIRTIFKSPNLTMKAAANVVIDECFIIRNVRLIDNGNGMFISMPSYQDRNGVWHSVCHPITPACRTEIQNAVIAAYNEA